MREAAESAETDQFNSQIAAASGAAGAQATPLYIVDMHLTCCTVSSSHCTSEWQDQEQGLEVDGRGPGHQDQGSSLSMSLTQFNANQSCLA